MNVEAFLEHARTAQGWTEQTLRAYRSDLGHFKAFLETQGLSRVTQIDHDVINRYIEAMRAADNPKFDRKGLSDATIARRLAAVSSYLEYVRLNSTAKVRNPVREVRRRWKRNTEPKPVDEGAIDSLLGGISNLRDRALFTLFLATGLRVSEMHQLNRDTIVIDVQGEINGQERITGVGEVVGKGGKRRQFYVDQQSLTIYLEYLYSREDDHPALFLSEHNERLSVRTIQHTLAAWCQKLGIAHINVHRLRHTYATRLANADISSIVLKDLMGHESFNTTQRYFKLTDQTLAVGYFSAMEQVNRYRGQVS
jgi:site-specific recombinase XerD